MKNCIVSIVLFIVSLYSFQSNAQKLFYKMPNGIIHNETFFKAIKEGITKNGNIKIELTDLRSNKDSIIKSVKLEIINTSNGTGFDPYGNHRKSIGSKFKIEAFKNAENINYNPEYLIGKPTLINFWFTKCPPCISEIPNLNNIQRKFENNVNFIAVTFDDKKLVDDFLKKKNINFIHITNAVQQLNDLQIEAYPMSLLLDKEGKILAVYGEISFDEKEIINKINTLL